VVGYLAGKQGVFDDYYVLHLNGEVRGFRLKEKNHQFFSCEELKAYFHNGNNAAVQDLSVEKVDLFRDVILGFDVHRMYTRFARYDFLEERAFGSEPVEMDGQGRNLKGSKGFSVNLATNEFELFGNVVGYFEPQSKGRKQGFGQERENSQERSE
jgi:hypothetical protein